MPRRSATDIEPGLRRLLNDLAPEERLGCSRQTLRTCLATLEEDSEFWRHVGQGSFRGSRPRHLPLRDTLLSRSP